MIVAHFHFTDETPDRELVVMDVAFKNGDSVWKYHDPNRVGFKRVTYKIGQLAYVQFGVK